MTTANPLEIKTWEEFNVRYKQAYDSVAVARPDGTYKLPLRAAQRNATLWRAYSETITLDSNGTPLKPPTRELKGCLERFVATCEAHVAKQAKAAEEQAAAKAAASSVAPPTATPAPDPTPVDPAPVPPAAVATATPAPTPSPAPRSGAVGRALRSIGNWMKGDIAPRPNNHHTPQH